MKSDVLNLTIFAMLIYLVKAVDDSPKPKFDFDLNEPAPSADSEQGGNVAPELHKDREVKHGLVHHNFPLRWNRKKAIQRTERKPIQDIDRLINSPSEQVKVRPKRKREYSRLSEERKEQYRKQKREAYAAKSKKEKKAIGLKNFQNYQYRLAKMTPEERKAYDEKQHQWEKHYLSRRRALWRINSDRRKTKMKKDK